MEIVSLKLFWQLDKREILTTLYRLILQSINRFCRGWCQIIWSAILYQLLKIPPLFINLKKVFLDVFFIIYQDHANKMNIFYLLLSKNIHISIQLIVRILRIYRGEGVLGGLLDTSPCTQLYCTVHCTAQTTSLLRIHGLFIECEGWRRHSSLIFLILLFTKPNIEVSGWLFQTKTHFTHIVYQPFSRVKPPNNIALANFLHR